MRKALPVLLTATALTFGPMLLPVMAADDDVPTATPNADAATATENPAPVVESWMAGPEKAGPSTGEDPSSAEAVDEADTDGAQDAAPEGAAPEGMAPEKLTDAGRGEGWIDPNADIATANPKDLGVTDHKVEIYKPLGSDGAPPTLDAK